MDANKAPRTRGLLSLRRYIAAAAIAIAVVILAIAIVVLITMRNQTLENSDRELSTVSRITAERTAQTFSAADLLIRSVQDLAIKPSLPDAATLRERASTPAFHDALVKLQQLLPQVDTTAVFNADGDMLVNNRQFPALRINIADAALFQTLKQRPDQGTAVSQPQLARIDKVWMIYLGRAVTDDQGRFVGVVLVGMPSQYFESYFSTIDVGPTTAIALITAAQGRLVARWPRTNGPDIGEVLPGANPALRLPPGKTRIDDVHNASQVTLHIAVTQIQLQDTPFFVAVSRTRDALLQPWFNALVSIILFALISLLVLGMLTWFILRAVGDQERWSQTLMQRDDRLSQQALELATARDTAERANRVRGEFLANMSHELRTPLNAVLGFSEILQLELFGPLGDTRYREFANDIHRSGRHLLDIIGNILDLTKIDAGKLELYEETIDIAGIMSVYGRLMTEAANTGGVTLEIQPPNGPTPILCDETRLRQILLNLLSNAVKFTLSGGRVVLSGRAAEDGFHLCVADTGIGMTDEESVMAMQPFHQIDSSLARRYQGTGLGLPLTKSLVDLHGGDMTIASAIGVGTTVTVRLPQWRLVVNH